MRLPLLLILFAVLAYPADPTLSSLVQQIKEMGLDPNECYKVRDLSFQKEDVKFYLNEGFVAFGKPIQGRRLSLVFSGDVESGDAEFLVMPPYRGERRSLAASVGTPNLNEHFKHSAMIFTDNTAEDLRKQILAQERVRKSEEQGILMARDYDQTLRNLSTSFTVRMVHDLLSPAQPGIFFATVGTARLGNIDIVYDPIARDQITIGQTSLREGKPGFEIWTSFAGRTARSRPVPLTPLDRILDMALDSTIEPNLHLKVRAKATLEAGSRPESVLAFELTRRMRLQSVKIDGEPVDFFERESMRDSLIRAREDSIFLVQPKQPFAPQSRHSIEFEQEGDVIVDAGNKVFYVASRGTWFPHRTGEFVRYDLTFHWPRQLDLVATGEVMEEKVDGEYRMVHRRVDQPVASVSFNLGSYQRAVVAREGYRVEAYGNRQVERALEPRTTVAPPAPSGFPNRPGWGRGEGRLNEALRPSNELPPNPTARLSTVANEVANALDYFRGNFGPPVLNQLTVSPIPGTFGQGFPGLIYLSTLTYLSADERPAAFRNENTFFSDVLEAHETAHQWWGNLVSTATNQDEWIMESLANYSALLYVEKRKGRGAVDKILAGYRDNLLRKTDTDIMEAAGPIIWGRRLEQAKGLSVWRTITYDKGTWIIHMLRRRLGDAAFMKMLADLRKKYEYQPLSTIQFQQFVQQYTDPKQPDAKLETFFDQWVYGTGIPSIKLSYAIKGVAPNLKATGEIVISNVDDDFLTSVPIEVVGTKAGKPVTQWLRVGSGSTPFSIPVALGTAKVALDPGNNVLKR